MNDPLGELEKLAVRARREQVPRVDVSGRILGQLGHLQEPPDRSLMVFAMASAATAAVVLALSTSLFNTVTDPLWTLFQTTPILTP